MKKVSFLLASTVSALAAILPLSATARTTDPAVRDPSAATESARPADTIRVSDAAKQQIAKKARRSSPPVGKGFVDSHFGEEIPQARRHKGPRFGEEIPALFPGLSFGEEIPQARRRKAPRFGEEIPALFPGLSFGEEIPQARRRKGPRFGEEIPAIFPGLSFGEEIPAARRRPGPMFGEEIPSVRRR